MSECFNIYKSCFGLVLAVILSSSQYFWVPTWLGTIQRRVIKNEKKKTLKNDRHRETNGTQP